jgi:hypothetical protein
MKDLVSCRLLSNATLQTIAMEAFAEKYANIDSAQRSIVHRGWLWHSTALVSSHRTERI